MTDINHNQVPTLSSLAFNAVVKLTQLAAKQPPARQALPWKTKFFYAFGHLFNDMTVSIWFSFTLLFFQPRLGGSLPGLLLLIGQIADAVCSPLVGYASDRCASTKFCKRFGRRKPWHCLGIVLSCISVPLLYTECLLGPDTPEMTRFFYYVVLVCVFQSAWAATQVTHVALINDLTPLQNERISLSSFRQAATMLANTAMYAMSLYFLETGTNESGSTLSKDDLVAFTYLAYSVCVLGVFLTIFFYVFVKEPEVKTKLVDQMELTDIKSTGTESTGTESTGTESLVGIESNLELHAQPSAEKRGKAHWTAWFCSHSFWIITLIYTFARMFVNISQVYMPLYLQYYLLLSKETLSFAPLVTNVSSFVFSFVINAASVKWGSRVTLVFGVVIGLINSGFIFFGDHLPFYNAGLIYLVAALTGIGGTALHISSLALNSALVGRNNIATNAFVFAAMSFFDKSINGVVIAVLELLKPAKQPHVPLVYYRYIMASLTGVPALLITFLLIAILRTNYGRPTGVAAVLGTH